jgi:ferredoxin-NADP reductase
MSPLLNWQIATVKAIKPETPRVKTFTLTLPAWMPQRAGQHYDVRLTAPDGYQAQRSYSVASEPERAGEIDLTVELVEGGEVSTYMHQVLVPGDLIEVRGPIGGYFVWQASMGGPLLLVAGGSGIVPLMAMLRHRAAVGSTVPARLLYSTRGLDDVIFRHELQELAASPDGPQVFLTLTRAQPPGWAGYARRVDEPMLTEVATPLGTGAWVYICGPTPFVEGVANALVQIGIPPVQIRTERFGPTGGRP